MPHTDIPTMRLPSSRRNKPPADATDTDARLQTAMRTGGQAGTGSIITNAYESYASDKLDHMLHICRCVGWRVGHGTFVAPGPEKLGPSRYCNPAGYQLSLKQSPRRDAARCRGRAQRVSALERAEQREGARLDMHLA